MLIGSDGTGMWMPPAASGTTPDMSAPNQFCRLALFVSTGSTPIENRRSVGIFIAGEPDPWIMMSLYDWALASDPPRCLRCAPTTYPLSGMTSAPVVEFFSVVISGAEYDHWI